MLDYIGLFPNEHEDEFNTEFLDAEYDKPMDYFVIECMKDFECIENIKILDITVVEDQDEVDINNHMININYKKKNLDMIPIPKHKYMLDSRFHEIIFKIQVKTNLNEKIIHKRILVPTMYDGSYLINNREMRVIWQLVDASTYSRRGNITMKSRMPILIYHNKNRETPDIYGNTFVLPSYSYAQDPSNKKRPGSLRKKNVRFYNPILIYASKMGIKKTISFFGMDSIVKIKKSYTKKEEKDFYIFECNEVFVLAKKDIFDSQDLVKAFVCMAVNIQSKDFPVTADNLEDKEYWTCRIGYLNSVKNKNIYSFYEKGRTSIHMIERLPDKFNVDSLRLPNCYKSDIYQLLYWMITNFEELKQKENMDMKNKRIRKNETVVSATLGKKINENINKLIERKSKSRMNTMDTLLELFNFNSDIIVSGMRNMNDIVKSDDASNDMAFMYDWAYSAKGFQTLGEIKLIFIENKKVIL